MKSKIKTMYIFFKFGWMHPESQVTVAYRFDASMKRKRINDVILYSNGHQSVLSCKYYDKTPAFINGSNIVG